MTPERATELLEQAGVTIEPGQSGTRWIVRGVPKGHPGTRGYLTWSRYNFAHVAHGQFRDVVFDVARIAEQMLAAGIRSL